MKNNVRSLVLAFLAIALYASLTAVGLAKGGDVILRGEVSHIEQSGQGLATVSVKLDRSELRVMVKPETQVEVAGDPVGIRGLAVKDFVKISGFFEDKGIVAREIEILDDKAGDFRLHGTIASVEGFSGRIRLRVEDSFVLVDDKTQLARRGQDEKVSASSLAMGMEIDVRGSIRDGQLVARGIMVGKRQDDPAKLQFEGRITDIQGSRLFVDTQGNGITVVNLTSSSVVKGNLEKGKEVEVKGALNDRFEVDALKVQVENEANDDKGGNTGNDDKGNHTGNDDKGGNTGNDDKGNNNGNKNTSGKG